MTNTSLSAENQQARKGFITASAYPSIQFGGKYGMGELRKIARERMGLPDDRVREFNDAMKHGIENEKYVVSYLHSSNEDPLYRIDDEPNEKFHAVKEMKIGATPDVFRHKKDGDDWQVSDIIQIKSPFTEKKFDEYKVAPNEFNVKQVKFELFVMKNYGFDLDRGFLVYAGSKPKCKDDICVYVIELSKEDESEIITTLEMAERTIQSFMEKIV